ncbi:MAG: UDP-N-acetylmuramoyl-tripeptide--D-alanyl-D-alanine ligase [Actinomycetota bacterium]
MIARPLSEIAAAIGGRLHGEDAQVSAVATDSRLVRPGDLFVALRGERADGHDHLADAMSRGAVGAVVDRAAIASTDAATSSVIEVADTGRALLDLAADERRRMPDAKVIGITGSNGKTSVKDLAAAVLSTRFRTHASPGSFNNEIGLPSTLLGVDPGTEVVVVEMGARREGDVAVLFDVARPDVVVVTNVGVAHMEVFGSWDAIARAGAEAVEPLGRDDLAILNADDAVVRGYAGRTNARVMTFGVELDADVRAIDVSLNGGGRASFLLEARGEREPVELAVAGEHMVSNALAAAACGVDGGLSPAECAAALKGARISPWRMETFATEADVVVINDAYNANPESMAAALKTARWMARGGRLAAVLGNMAELGSISFDEHERLGELVVRVGVDRLITLGEPALAIARAAVREGQLPEDVASYEDPLEAAADLRAWARAGDVVLLKGSRVAGVERVAEGLR